MPDMEEIVNQYEAISARYAKDKAVNINSLLILMGLMLKELNKRGAYK